MMQLTALVAELRKVRLRPRNQQVGVKQRRVSGDERCWSMLAAPAKKRLDLIL